MSPWIPLAIGSLSLLLNGYAWWRFTLPGQRETHRARQAARLKYDGIQPPFLMCWVYWFGVEKWFYGKRIRDFGGTA